jgi:hypothetical protein
MLISLSCDSACRSGLTAGETQNVLWPYKLSANNSLLYFTDSYYIYLPSVTNIQALEYDMFQFTGTRYMFGSECDNPSYTSGKWRIWNSAGGSWVSTAAPCTLFASPGVWHLIEWQVHRVSGDTGCGGDPCMYYDQLTVDGVNYGPFTSEPATTSSDPDAFGIQFQIDARYNSTTAVEYLDEVNFTVSTSPSTNYTLSVTAATGGTVADNLSRISCPSTCSASYASGTSVTLTPTTLAGYQFSGWVGGGCTGTGNCTITMTAAQTTTAVFVPTMSGNGGITVTGGVTIQGGVYVP